MPGRGTTRSSRGKALPTAPQATKKRKNDEPSGAANLAEKRAKAAAILVATEAARAATEAGRAEKEALATWKNQGESDKEWTSREGLQPVNMHVPDKLNVIIPDPVKDIIWEGGFVNLHCFLEKKQEEVSTTHISLIDGGFIKKDTIKRVKNIFEWTTAFTRYMSIYLQQSPMKCLEMLKYLDNVRMAAEKFKGYGWREYDEQFRMELAKYPTKNWGELDYTLWLQCVMNPYQGESLAQSNDQAANYQGHYQGRNTPFHRGRGGYPRQRGAGRGRGRGQGYNQFHPQNQYQGNQNASTQSRYFCKDFNNNENCSRGTTCKFPHICSNCGLPHPSNKCGNK